MGFFNNLSQISVNVRYASNFRKPLLICKLMRNALLGLLGIKLVRGIDIIEDYGCNMSCKHCNISGLIRGEEEKLTAEQWKRVVKDANKLGVVSFTITGGEPLLNKDLEGFIKIFEPWKNLMIIQTNGWLLDKEKVLWLKRIGVDICNLSLDSYDEKEHDSSRGMRGSYRKVMEIIKYCKRFGPKPMIGTVISHKNVHGRNLMDLIRFAEREKILLLANLAVPAGRWSSNKEVLLTEEDQRFIRALSRKHKALRLDFNSNLLRYGCPAFKEKMYITPYGEVCGCTFVQISFGNLKTESLIDIRKKGLSFGPFSEYNEFCLAAESKDFIKRYMSQIRKSKKTPISIKEVKVDEKDALPGLRK
jgi:MoaA/NifB/PqqE/SkfB family radical SAM enzyme